ncbi:MAG: metallophosphoesterase, partial [Acidobacteria bacterium]|nr:metallophosphoesterase [Acidobacteriota bacterium]
HTHIPCVFKTDGAAVSRLFPAPDGTRVSLREGERFLINPGSVGQPRDEDPRAAFLILDETSREVSFHRVNYPIQKAQIRILEAGLPPLLAQRLQRGV